MKEYKVEELIKAKVKIVDEKQFMVEVSPKMVGFIFINEMLPIKIEVGSIHEFRVLGVHEHYLMLSMITTKETDKQRRKRLAKLGITKNENNIISSDDQRSVDLEEERMIEEQIREDAWEYNENH